MKGKQSNVSHDSATEGDLQIAQKKEGRSVPFEIDRSAHQGKIKENTNHRIARGTRV